MREIWSYWHALSKAAVLEERQRIACELHDGVAQELAYLARNLESLDGEADEDSLGRLRRAVERARLESRRVISGAAAPGREPFEVALAEAVTEVAERCHVKLDLDITPDIRLPALRRAAFMRIACEAVTNAARLGHEAKVMAAGTCAEVVGATLGGIYWGMTGLCSGWASPPRPRPLSCYPP